MSDTIFTNSGMVTTILGTVNQFQSFLNLPSNKFYTTTTLNAKYEIFKDVEPSTLPKLRYFGIGIKGFQIINTDSSIKVIQPEATNMDLYTPIPIRVRPADDDIPETERQQYRMRVLKTYKGVQYVCYYLKVIDWEPDHVEIKKVVGTEETEYEFDTSHLNPTPPSTDTGSAEASTRVIVRATGACEIKGSEVLEYCEYLADGDTSASFISEIGFYTGCDVYTNADYSAISTTATNYYESIYTQLAKHRCFRGADLSTEESSIVPYCCLEYDTQISTTVE